MGEDISLFDAAFFNLAADVASVSLLGLHKNAFLQPWCPES